MLLFCKGSFVGPATPQAHAFTSLDVAMAAVVIVPTAPKMTRNLPSIFAGCGRDRPRSVMGCGEAHVIPKVGAPEDDTHLAQGTLKA